MSIWRHFCGKKIPELYLKYIFIINIFWGEYGLSFLTDFTQEILHSKTSWSRSIRILMTIFFYQVQRKYVSFIIFFFTLKYRNDLLKTRNDARSIMQAFAHLNFKIIKGLWARFIIVGRWYGHKVL